MEAHMAFFDAHPPRWHELLTEPGVAAAVAAAFTDAFRPFLSPRPPADTPPGGAFLHWSRHAGNVLEAVIYQGAGACACADGVLVDGLVAGLADVCPPAQVDAVLASARSAPYRAILECMVGWALTAAAAPGKSAALMSLPRGGGGGCGPAGSATSAAPYADVRARVARWAAQPSLLQWSVACARAQVRQAVDTAADALSDGTVVGRLQAFTPSLLAWATLAPRQLLDAAPGVVARLVDLTVELASSQPLTHNLPLVLSLMTAVEKLSNVDPGRLRSVPCLPRAVVAASSYLTAQPRPYGAPHETVASSVLALLGLYAPAGVHRMAGCPELLEKMIAWAAPPPMTGVAARTPGSLSAHAADGTLAPDGTCPTCQPSCCCLWPSPRWAAAPSASRWPCARRARGGRGRALPPTGATWCGQCPTRWRRCPRPRFGRRRRRGGCSSRTGSPVPSPKRPSSGT